MNRRNEEGMVAIYTALLLLFLVGSVALAADTSGFFRSARVDQTTADLACLAGVQELPGDAAAARAIAADNARTNFPRIATGTTSPASDQLTISVGGHQVLINTNWTGDPKKMRVRVTSSEPRNFSRIWGSSDVPVRQEAVCIAVPAAGGPGMLPIGTLAGTFDGDIHDCAEKTQGACGALDSGSGTNDLRGAIADGLSGDIEKHHGNWNLPDASTGTVGTICSANYPAPVAGPCNAIDSQPGNHTAIRQGIQSRLSRVAEADCTIGSTFNCDSLAQVIHGGATPPPIPTLFQALGSTPPASLNWQDSLYGPYSAAMHTQFYYDGDIEKCDSPRLVTVPIVYWNGTNSGVPNDWDLNDSRGTMKSNKLLKIIGFYTMYIDHPANPSEIGNFLVTDVIWFGPNAECDGDPVQFYGGPPVSGSVKLVAS